MPQSEHLKVPVRPVVLEAIVGANARALRLASTQLAYKLAMRTWGSIDQDNVVAAIYAAINEEIGARAAVCARDGHIDYFDMGDPEPRCGQCGCLFSERNLAVENQAG